MVLEMAAGSEALPAPFIRAPERPVPRVYPLMRRQVPSLRKCLAAAGEGTDVGTFSGLDAGYAFHYGNLHVSARGCAAGRPASNSCRKPCRRTAVRRYVCSDGKPGGPWS